jgi:hypothetical protein
MWKTTCKSLQGPRPIKLLNFADWMRNAIVKAKEDGDFINEHISNIAGIELSHPILTYLLEFFFDVFETFIIIFWIFFGNGLQFHLPINHIPPCEPMGAIIESTPLMNKGRIVIWELLANFERTTARWITLICWKRFWNWTIGTY